MPPVQRPEPVYVQVVRSIRERILSGELSEGDHIPSARKIMEEWSIAIATAQKVIAALKSEGLVRTVPGNGTVVAGTQLKQTARDRMYSIRSTGRIYPPGEHAKIRSAEIVEADSEVADALGVKAGAPVIRRRRVTYRGDTPVSASISWFHGDFAEIAPRLLDTERIIQGTFGYIEEITGRSGVRGSDQFAADAATEEDAEDLGIPAGSPVLRGRNLLLDANGDVLEYGQSVAVSVRYVTCDYEIARP